ncbi:hypothetical protein [Comamonas sp.]|uniref:hypothetical protein n=1 Tax=Comamonas sp. TaxID=34028 RepID=UPI00289D6955|nr:hypothetical protein [Comamonas sp.]
MGRRFGRNQKRRLRVQIASLETAQKQGRHQLEQVRSQHRRLEQLLQRATEVLGAYSVALPPQTECRSDFEPFALSGEFLMHVPQPLDLLAADDLTAPPGMLQVERMYTLLARFEDTRALDGRLHLRIALASGEVVYAISESALRSLPSKELERRLQEEAGRMIARKLMETIRPGSRTVRTIWTDR